ncbi:MAG TPA: TlpA disulfide reductase family protein [Solirubrobacteraceae bacterium]|nr:TlpA disulfide reductase family protein [Solirubrobacteraceae bacterium]
MSGRSRSRLLLSLALVALVVLVGLLRHAAGPQSAEPSRAAIAAAFAGSPPALAALHSRGGRLLSGGLRGFDAQLLALRGQPVVVALWASWCAACRRELPTLQRVSVADGRRVAFLGVDVRDPPPAGADLLRSFPVSYPSWLDPSGKISRSLTSADAYPQTVFIDRHGSVVDDHLGTWATAAALQRAVVAHLLG